VGFDARVGLVVDGVAALREDDEVILSRLADA